MLQRIKISNYALIDNIELEFKNGLSVVTGETGSGKSILLGALGLALGDRASSSSVRHGAEVCFVEASFNHKGKQIVIRREVNANGRSKAFINDSQSSVAELKELGDQLVDLHGQDETRALLNRDTRLKLLDSFGGHIEANNTYEKSFNEWRDAELKLSKLIAKSKLPQADVGYLKFQADELDQLKLHIINYDKLEAELNTLKNATEIAAGLYNAHSALSEIDLASTIKVLSSISEHSKEARELLDRLESTRIELDDISNEAQNTSESISFDEERMNILEEQLDNYKKALMKHKKASAADLSAYLDEVHELISDASGLEKRIEELKLKVQETYNTMITDGKSLMDARIISGKDLLKKVTAELKPLKLPDVNMDWVFEEASSPDILGIEDVELMFSANPGSPMQPLSDVASGGEKSRVMLAFKAGLASKKVIPTIVLDEIDTGVSGDVATRMASAMKSMSSGQQVFSVTHLAQVAAQGDQHLEITKNISKGTAHTNANYLNEEDRIEAIARMLSGENTTDEARAQARNLRNQKP